MVQNIFYELQQQVVDILKEDTELSSVIILAENRNDIEFEIQNALGNQGLVCVVMTVGANFIGNYEDEKLAFEVDELVIQVVENVTVNRGRKNALTGQDVSVRILEWLSSPKYGRNGMFNPINYEQGEDSNLLVNKCTFKCAIY